MSGQWIAAGCEDGSIQMWDGTKKIFVNVALENRQAHQVTVICTASFNLQYIILRYVTSHYGSKVSKNDALRKNKSFTRTPHGLVRSCECGDVRTRATCVDFRQFQTTVRANDKQFRSMTFSDGFRRDAKSLLWHFPTTTKCWLLGPSTIR